MATIVANKRNERVRKLAKGYYGDALISWLKEIRDTYSDVRTAQKLKIDMPTAIAVANILEQELIEPLETWRGVRSQLEPPEQGSDSE